MIVVLPHLGILDSWLPILDELKRRGLPITITAVAPDWQRLSRSQTEDFLLDQCNALVDRVLTRSSGETWTCFGSFDEAADYARDRVRRFRKRPIEAFYRLFPRLATALDGAAPHAAVVLTDTDMLGRLAMKGLRYKSRRASWFSLPHGIDPRLPIIGGPPKRPPNVNLTIYASSDQEAKHYEEGCGLPRSRIKVVGVPRHSQQWIGRLRDFYGRGQTRGRHIFLASRPVNKSNFQSAKKVELLEALATLAGHLGCSIVIRLHPKETDEDRSIIERAFGRERLARGWSYSNLPSMIAGHGALFAVTMFSSVAADMLAVNVPVIELFDFSALTDNPSLVSNAMGRRTSIYQHLGLAVGAANLTELETAARAILTDRRGVLEELNAAYNRVYATPDNAIDAIATEISKALGGRTA